MLLLLKALPYVLIDDSQDPSVLKVNPACHLLVSAAGSYSTDTPSIQGGSDVVDAVGRQRPHVWDDLISTACERGETERRARPQYAAAKSPLRSRPRRVRHQPTTLQPFNEGGSATRSVDESSPFVKYSLLTDTPLLTHKE